MANQITENDVESLGEKLEHFSQALTPGEQAALAEVFEHATPQGEDDVQGFGHMQARAAEGARAREGARGKRILRRAETAQVLRLVVGGHFTVR